MKVGTDAVLIGAWAKKVGRRVLDIGTGTGIISLMLAQRFPEALITGVEIDKYAAEEAASNFNDSPWSGRLEIVCEKIQSFKPGDKFDTIITNPPYFIRSTEAPDEKRFLARHGSQLSLEILASNIQRLLNKDGNVHIILPLGEGEAFIQIMKEEGFYLAAKAEFIPTPKKNVERYLMTFSKVEEALNQEVIFHYDETGNWSEKYKELTKDFYLVL